MFVKFIEKFLSHDKTINLEKKNVTINGLDENGNICLVTHNESDDKQQDNVKKVVASEFGFEPTTNPSIYYDKEKSCYMVWDDKKQKFKKDKTIVKVYDNAYIERLGKKDISSTFYKPDGTEMGLKNKDILIEVLELKKPDKSWIPSGWGHYYHLHYSESENKYYEWDDNKRNFVLSEITDISGEYYFAKGDKYYKAGYGQEPDVEISAEEFYSRKEK